MKSYIVFSNHYLVNFANRVMFLLPFFHKQISYPADTCFAVYSLSFSGFFSFGPLTLFQILLTYCILSSLWPELKDLLFSPSILCYFILHQFYGVHSDKDWNCLFKQYFLCLIYLFPSHNFESVELPFIRIGNKTILLTNLSPEYRMEDSSRFTDSAFS